MSVDMLRGKSTETVLPQLIDRIEKGFHKEKCKNTVLSGRYYTTRWIGVMLKHRKVTAEIGTSSIEVKMDRGCPQGGLFSLLFWGLVMDLIANLDSFGFFTQRYAEMIWLFYLLDQI